MNLGLPLVAGHPIGIICCTILYDVLGFCRICSRAGVEGKACVEGLTSLMGMIFMGNDRLSMKVNEKA